MVVLSLICMEGDVSKDPVRAKADSVKMNFCIPRAVARKMFLVETNLGVRKSAQISILVNKYLAKEYPSVGLDQSPLFEDAVY